MFMPIIKKISVFIPFLITGLIIYLLFSNFDIGQTVRIIQTGSKFFLFLSIFFIFLTTLVLALRWKIMLGLCGHKDSYNNILKKYLASVPFSKTTPSNSGDFIRAVYTKNKIGLTKGSGIVFMENLLDIYVLTFFALFGSLIKGMLGIFLIIFFIVVLSFFLLFILNKINLSKLRLNNKFKQKIQSFFSIFREFKKNSISFFLKILILTSSAWILVIGSFVCLFIAFGIDVPFFEVVFLQPIIIFLGLLPITVSGVGIRESAIIFFYAGYGSAASLMAVGLSYSCFSAIILPLLYLPFSYQIIKKKLFYARK
ncbi:MAG: flippase-like domain-containing protein [Candidatus Magasanikbacteria bacterium]|nr:flippase-like domain-containing protein [Candidatus Magasanikbacteria bacterium]